jgi:hypothetical protein
LKSVIEDELLPPSPIAIKDAASRTEGTLNRKLVVMLKMVVFAPIPSARQKIAVSAKPGLRRSARAA